MSLALLILAIRGLSAASLPAYSVIGDLFFNHSPGTRISPNDFGTFSLTDSRYGAVSLSIAGTPSPVILANADIGTGFEALTFGRSSGMLIYSFEITGPAGPVPVLVDVAGGVSASASAGASFALVSSWNLSLAGVSLAGDEIRTPQLTGSFSQGFDRTVSLSLLANQLYSVTLVADVGAAASDQGSRSITSAFVDPVFTLGPGADSQTYEFVFSNGIGNTPGTPVPEPVTGTLLVGCMMLVMAAVRKFCIRRSAVQLVH